MFTTKKIKAPATIGQRLKAARLRGKISLEQAEAGTLVRAKYLAALEADSWQAIPGRVYLLGFLRQYADFLGLDGRKIIDQFNGQFTAWVSPRSTARPGLPIKNQLTITPRLIAAVAVVCLVAAVFAGVGWQINGVYQKPSLVVVAPGDNILWREAELEIVGKASQGAVVLINEQNVSQDERGNFRQVVNLQDGVNKISIVARTRFNKETRKTITVLKTANSPI